MTSGAPTQRARRERNRDALLVPVVFAVDLLLFGTFLQGTPAPTGPQQVLQVVVTAASCAVLLARRRAPSTVFVVVCGCAVVGRLVVVGLHPTLALLVGLTAVAERRGPARSITTALVALIPGAVEVYLTAADGTFQRLPAAQIAGQLAGVGGTWVVLVGLAWAFGRWLGRNSRHIRRLEAERERQRLLAERAVADERARIARELHDIVSNAVTVMVLHAAGARRVMHGDPARAEAALTTIENAGAQAMGELRRLLGLLRDTGMAGADGLGAGRGLAQLDSVVDDVRTAGVDVRTEVVGQPRSLDPSVDLAAYRVVQEALTNVAKHGGPGTSATVRIDWNPAWLGVHVVDDGAGHAGDAVRVRTDGISTGHGLLGLRERLGVVGGTLTAGAGEGGGYRVDARLPVVAGAGP